MILADLLHIRTIIKKVYYIDDKYAETDSTKASKYMFEKAKAGKGK